MSTKLSAILSISPYFCEIGLFENPSQKKSEKPKHHFRLFLPHQSLTQELKKIWQEHKPSEVIINTHFCNKVLDSKLGGSVAQILSEKISKQEYESKITSSHFGSLGTPDHIYNVATPIKISDMESLLTKLKTAEIKRICLHLNENDFESSETELNLETTLAYIQAQGFEVFYQNENNNSDLSHLRKNTLNACLSGVFSEHIEEIRNSFSSDDTNYQTPSLSICHFQNIVEKDCHNKQISESLWSWLQCLAHFETEKCILALEMDQWIFIDPSQNKKNWESSWGEISLAIPHHKKLQIQPSQEIFLGLDQCLNFSQKEFGFEPGPMFFGRSQRPLVFDLLCAQFEIEFPFTQNLGKKRFLDQMTALEKNLITNKNNRSSEKSIYLDLSQYLLFQIGCEILFLAKNKPIVLTGFFADIIYPELKKTFPLLTIELDPLAKDRQLICSRHQTNGVFAGIK
jgi:N-methylhydantoinase A